MKRIETGRYEPSADNPNKLAYTGQRTAQEVFKELEYRLKAEGYLPDEYFSLNSKFEDGNAFPENAEIICSVNWGSSEGIYLDVTLRSWDELGKMQMNKFATGKTLGESDNDLDRMYLIASACTKAFHSPGVHDRYVSVPKEGSKAVDEPISKPSVIHLNEQEKKIVADSLIETRSRFKAEKRPLEEIEQLLRRVIGSITGYIKAVGERPQNIDYGDRASLAIMDGNKEEFKKALPHVPHLYGNLLTEAVSRPDQIGREMSQMILGAADNLSNDIYKQAGYKAIQNKDIGSMLMLLEHAPNCVANLDKEFSGDMILHALSANNKKMANQIASSGLADIKGADPHLLKVAIMDKQYELAKTLIDNSIDIKSEPAMLYFTIAKQKNVEFAHILMENGADPNGQKSAALTACMQTNDIPSAMFLLKCGANFDSFMGTVAKKFDDGELSPNETNFIFAVKSFWENSILMKPSTTFENESDYEMDQE